MADKTGKSTPDEQEPGVLSRDVPVTTRPKEPPTRRAFLTGATSLLGTAATHVLLAPFLGRAAHASGDPTRVPGALATEYGRRSPFERAKRLTRPQRSRTPLQDLHGIVTPSALHFERHHNGVPRIDPAKHRLLVHGLVERPLLFTIAELKRFPATSRLVFVECSGNSGKEWKGPKGKTVQEIHGLTSTSEWTGVRLSAVLSEAGLASGAAWMLAEGSDAAAMTRSIPLDRVLDEALLCYAQNGEPLRPEQGYPLRLLVPGFEANTCIKWLRRLKLVSSPLMTREETSKYTDLMPDGTVRQFTFDMEAKSVITAPSGGQRLKKTGYVEIRGLAWSGRGRVEKVEVSVDGGKNWRTARLQASVLPKCHTRFCLDWWWDGGEAVLQSRCTDETGYRQPTRQELVDVRGTNSYYHYNAIQSWKIDEEGNVSNVQV